MDVKKLTRSIFAAAILSGVCVTAQAANCALGTNCAIPTYTGESAKISVSPVSGTNYLCTVTSSSEHSSLKFNVSSGRDYVITHGDGYYKARPSATFLVEGYFNPNHPYAQGEIKITPYSGTGTVSCYPKFY